MELGVLGNSARKITVRIHTLAYITITNIRD